MPTEIASNETTEQQLTLDTLQTRGPRIKDVEKLYPYEQKWRDRQPMLSERGYHLRPRFMPGWRPSWKKWDWLPACIKYGLMNPYSREDSLPLAVRVIPIPYASPINATFSGES